MKMTMYYLAVITTERTPSGEVIETAAYAGGPFPTVKFAESLKPDPNKFNAKIEVVEHTVEVSKAF